MKHEKTFAAIEKLKDVELELHRLKNALELANKALDAQPAPPPTECKTEAEKIAYSFGWWKALEYVKAKQPAQYPVECMCGLCKLGTKNDTTD